MGYVKERIAELTKEFGGKIKASKASMDWFQEGIKSKKVSEAQSTRGRFEPGKIYVFEYFPKYAKQLPWFDEHPVVLAIEQDGDNDFGVNLNLLPVEFKERFLDELYTKMNIKTKEEEPDIISELLGIKPPSKNNALTEKPLKITYKGMKKYLEKFGYDFALRQYIPSRRKGLAVVSYSKWPEIAICNFMEFHGTNVMKIRLMFNDYLKKNI